MIRREPSRASGAELPYQLHFIEQPGQGAAAARNLGVAKATAPLILFLDDDMTAAPTLIEAHLSSACR